MIGLSMLMSAVFFTMEGELAVKGLVWDVTGRMVGKTAGGQSGTSAAR